eukprot:ANDGO_00577.mRNA.1 hypothetical protein
MKVLRLNRDSAFQQAVNEAVQGNTVLYLTKEAHSTDTLYSKGVDSEVMERISFKFFATLDLLKKYLCFAHLVLKGDSIPACVVMDWDDHDSICTALLKNLAETMQSPPILISTLASGPNSVSIVRETDNCAYVDSHGY